MSGPGSPYCCGWLTWWLAGYTCSRRFIPLIDAEAGGGFATAWAYSSSIPAAGPDAGTENPD
jgi:hypothetical protein